MMKLFTLRTETIRHMVNIAEEHASSTCSVKSSSRMLVLVPIRLHKVTSPKTVILTFQQSVHMQTFIEKNTPRNSFCMLTQQGKFLYF